MSPIVQLGEQAGSTKLVWTFGSTQRVYCVNKGSLQDACRVVRDVLRRIADDYRLPSGDYRPYHADLANAGEELKAALFTTVDGAFRDDILARLRELPPGTPLQIFSDATVQVPWNFVFVGDVAGLAPAAGQLRDFDDFWSSRFRVNVRYHETDEPPGRPITRANIRTLLALHESRFRAAAALLEDRPEVLQQLTDLLAFEEGEARDWDDCRTKWQRIVERHENSILYVFAHRDDERGDLFLRDEDAIPRESRLKYVRNANGFKTLFKKPNGDHSSTLCFINGCRTADGELGQEFLSMTSYSGFQGFIGSEAEISEKWATAYAIQFLHRLIIGSRTVQEAYDELRVECFPTSLWYSCCAYPDFRVVAA